MYLYRYPSCIRSCYYTTTIVYNPNLRALHRSNHLVRTTHATSLLAAWCAPNANDVRVVTSVLLVFVSTRACPIKIDTPMSRRGEIRRTRAACKQTPNPRKYPLTTLRHGTIRRAHVPPTLQRFFSHDVLATPLPKPDGPIATCQTSDRENSPTASYATSCAATIVKATFVGIIPCRMGFDPWKTSL